MSGGSRVRLTVAQALVRFLAAQRSERDGSEQPLFAGCFGIFGHGNLAGLGQALLEAELGRPGSLRYYQARNEQAMVHASAAFAPLSLSHATSRFSGGRPVGSQTRAVVSALADTSVLPSVR